MQSGDVMELANILLALGGDRNNTVPKYRVTPAEIAVLSAIHGVDAVFDIIPTGETEAISFRDERERLLRNYQAKNDDGNLIVLQVYPGTAPVLHTSIESLGLDESLFKPTEHAKPTPAKAAKKVAKVEQAEPIAKIVKDTTSADHLFDDEPADASVME
jgi:hypothetical protein